MYSISSVSVENNIGMTESISTLAIKFPVIQLPPLSKSALSSHLCTYQVNCYSCANRIHRLDCNCSLFGPQEGQVRQARQEGRYRLFEIEGIHSLIIFTIAVYLAYNYLITSL